MPGTEPTPLIGIPCSTRIDGEHPTHWVGDKYVVAVLHGVEGLPVLVPAMSDPFDAENLARRLDGLLITGARSNVEPHLYEGEPSAPGTLHDPPRDATVLPLIRAAVAVDLPVLGICRGIQELNVALGGSLHQRVHEVPGRRDHRSRRELPLAERYAHNAHHVALAPDGLLARLAGASEILVNSLHGQGIDRLAPGLTIEATADDGQIEAVRLPAASFVVGVQWHPEFRFASHPFSHALIRAFGAACHARANRRP